MKVVVINLILCLTSLSSLYLCKELKLTLNEEEYSKHCNEGDTLICYEESVRVISNSENAFIPFSEIEKTENVEHRDKQIEYNNKLANYWFNAGQIEYLGLIKKKPNLSEGFGKFIVSAFFGNAKALYKLYIFIETEMLKLLIDSKDFEYTKSSSIASPYLKTIFNKTETNFSSNFYYEDDYEKNSISLQFLYASALGKYQSAMNTLAYKFYKGYGVTKSCEGALKYYKETASQNVKEITNRHKPNYYEKVNLATYEYVGHKFSNEVLDIEDLIDYFKVEAMNGNVQYMYQLGQRYFYGQGIPQDFDQAFYYFQLGSQANDSNCIYFLGEMYLNGWGVEKNYSEAFRLFSQAMGMQNSKAWNSLGYMYYYGLGVEKNVKRAYDYFKISFTKGEESDAYYNMVTLLAEGNDQVEADFPNAYKYANFIAAKGHTFGTYFFGMLNEYQLGSILKTCEITVEFFKQVSERNLYAKHKFDTAIKLYREGFYKIATLIYIELAEEGFEFGQVNAGLMLKNYDIFISSQYNKYLAFKYFKMAYKAKNIFATLTLADFYHYGFGELPKNFTKAADLYKKVIQSGTENSFYVSHAYFNLGQMNQCGEGVEKNTTRAVKFYNESITYEPNALYPSLLMKYYILFESSNFTELLSQGIVNLFVKLTTPGIPLYSLIGFVAFYIFFITSLYLQKE